MITLTIHNYILQRVVFILVFSFIYRLFCCSIGAAVSPRGTSSQHDYCLYNYHARNERKRKREKEIEREGKKKRFRKIEADADFPDAVISLMC